MRVGGCWDERYLPFACSAPIRPWGFVRRVQYCTSGATFTMIRYGGADCLARMSEVRR